MVCSHYRSGSERRVTSQAHSLMFTRFTCQGLTAANSAGWGCFEMHKFYFWRLTGKDPCSAAGEAADDNAEAATRRHAVVQARRCERHVPSVSVIESPRNPTWLTSSMGGGG